MAHNMAAVDLAVTASADDVERDQACPDDVGSDVVSWVEGEIDTRSGPGPVGNQTK